MRRDYLPPLERNRGRSMKILINKLLMSLGGRNDRPRNSVDAWINFAKKNEHSSFEIESQQEFVSDELFVYYGKVIIIFIQKLTIN